MNRKMLDALEACLQAMEKGEDLEAVLRRYPQFASDLRPRLEAARLARTPGQAGVPMRVVARSRSRVLAAAAGLRQERSRCLRIRPFLRYALASVAAVAFLVLSGNGLLVASARSLPGDILYPVKRSVETTQLNLSSDPVRRQELQQQFSQRRVEEIKSLITIKRVSQVDFDGLVSAQTQDGWVISGVSVVVRPQTVVIGRIAVGKDAEVSGETQESGWVLAAQVKADWEGGGQQPGTAAAVSPTGISPHAGSEHEDGGTSTPGKSWSGGTHTPDGSDDQAAKSTWSPTHSSNYSGDHPNGGVHTPEPTEAHDPGWTRTATPEATEKSGSDD